MKGQMCTSRRNRRSFGLRCAIVLEAHNARTRGNDLGRNLTKCLVTLVRSFAMLTRAMRYPVREVPRTIAGRDHRSPLRSCPRDTYEHRRAYFVRLPDNSGKLVVEAEGVLAERIAGRGLKRGAEKCRDSRNVSVVRVFNAL